ncbi:hypothetical protein VTN02DRAFT_1596 [Thermoascus thermophilus]
MASSLSSVCWRSRASSGATEQDNRTPKAEGPRCERADAERKGQDGQNGQNGQHEQIEQKNAAAAATHVNAAGRRRWPPRVAPRRFRVRENRNACL